LRSLSDFKGQELIARVLDVVDQHRPLHVSIVGGDPLVRYRELEVLLPELVKRAHIQVVTSAFRPIPLSWARLPNLQLVVSVDGLPPEHDVRRKPATYERILRNIQGHHIFAQTTCTLSADFKTRVEPCQFGGDPDCSRCGCIASMGLAAVGHHKLVGPITAGHIFWTSRAIGRYVRRGENTLQHLVSPKQGELSRDGYHGVSRTKDLLNVID
jgi:hypothetical protein